MFEDVHAQISSILLGSANLIWDQSIQHVHSLWGLDADMSEGAGSRPKRIGFLIATIFPAIMYLAYGYIYGVVGLTIASVEGDELSTPASEKPVFQTEKPSSDQNSTDLAASLTTDVEAAKPAYSNKATSTANENLYPMPAGRAPQARLAVRSIMRENHAPPAVRHGLIYLLLSLLLSRTLHWSFFTLTGSDGAAVQWTVHLLTSIFLQTVRMLWTHAVITDPGYPTPYLMDRSYTDWLKANHALALPTLVYAIAQPGVVLCTTSVCKFLYNRAVAEEEDGWAVVFAFATIIILAGFLVTAALVATVVNPAFLLLNRVEVSLLREGVPTAVSLYTQEEPRAGEREKAGKKAGEYGDGYYATHVGPSVRAWKSISTQTLKDMGWMCCIVTLWVGIPGGQFLQIGAQVVPGS